MVSLVVVLASGGLTIGLAWFWVVRHALARRRRWPLDWLVVCGHALADGAPSAEYRVRLERAEILAGEQPAMQLLLTGGGRPSEAAVGREWLIQHGRVDSTRIVLEESSRDTFENLRQARAQVPDAEVMGVLSSRSHLGRIRLYAVQLGLAVKLVPAEDAWYPSPGNLLISLREAAFVCWFVIGRWWARLGRRKHLLARLQ